MIQKCETLVNKVKNNDYRASKNNSFLSHIQFFIFLFIVYCCLSTAKLVFFVEKRKKLMRLSKNSNNADCLGVGFAASNLYRQGCPPSVMRM